jgi:hypothetical protein
MLDWKHGNPIRDSIFLFKHSKIFWNLFNERLNFRERKFQKMHKFCSDVETRIIPHSALNQKRTHKNFLKQPTTSHSHSQHTLFSCSIREKDTDMMMTSLDAIDLEIGGGITSNPGILFGNTAITTMNSDEYARCNRCGYGGCDVRFVGCSCTMHA